MDGEVTVNFTLQDPGIYSVGDKQSSKEDLQNNSITYTGEGPVTVNFTLRDPGTYSIASNEGGVGLRSNSVTYMGETQNYISSIKQNNEKYYIKDNDLRENITTVEENTIYVNVDEDDTLLFTIGNTPQQITFKVYSVTGVSYHTFTANSGMTWYEYCKSDYNSEGEFLCDGNDSLVGNQSGSFTLSIHHSSTQVRGGDTITDNAEYKWSAGGDR